MGQYYDSSNSYQTPAGQSFQNSPWTKAYFDQQPDALWTRFGAENGVGQGDSAFETYFRQQRTRAKEGYEAALGTNPLLRFQNYVEDNLSMGGLQRGFEGLSAGQRGERQEAFAPNSRFVMRG